MKQRHGIPNRNAFLESFRNLFNHGSGGRRLKGRTTKPALEPLEPRICLSYDPALAHAIGEAPADVVSADINGDGRVDLITVNRYDEFRNGSVSVLLGDGAGGFSSQQEYETGREPVGLVISDLDRDRHPDVVAASYTSHGVSVLLGTGDPDGNGLDLLAPYQQYATGVFPTSLALADVNGDGNDDLLVATDSATAV